MMDANLRNIRKKLASGEILTANDLRSLDPLHDAIYDNDGRVIGISGSSSKKELNELQGDFNLEYVDRSLFGLRHRRQQGQVSERLPRLVRYVGMVQDMLDPEFYESYDDRGRSKHFGDFCSWNCGCDNSNSEDDDCMVDSTESSKNKCESHHMTHYSEFLAERIPLVVVPIPFASDWLFRGIHGRSSCDSDPRGSDSNGRRQVKSKSAVVSPISSNRGERKRGYNEVNVDEDSNMNVDRNHSSYVNENSETNQQTKQKTTPDIGNVISTESWGEKGVEDRQVDNSATTTDWWPVGTCRTSMDDCPILAKICYDLLLNGEQEGRISGGERKEEQIEVELEDIGAQKPSRSRKKLNQRPLMLNDVVSLVGVLSMNPWEADFSGQQSASISSENTVDCYEYEPMMAATNSVPPPSRLPRLHVLSYRRFDLDDLARRAVNLKKDLFHDNIDDNNNLLQEREGVVSGISKSDSESDDDCEVEWSGFPMGEKCIPSGLASFIQETSSRSLMLPESTPWVQALWACLLSQADRRRAKSNFVSRDDGTAPKILRAGPAERALGCVSLQLSTPDVASAKALYIDLAENVLPAICPVVATLDLTKTGTSDSLVPRKDCSGRMKPCPIQLPKGAVVLVHFPLPCPNIGNDQNQCSRSKNSSKDDEKLRSVQTALRELVQHHRIPYKFEGGVMIPFEADYRVIVVTTQTQDLPCTLRALARTCSPTETSMEVSSTRTNHSKSRLREILMKGRSVNSNNDSFKFSSILLERAQRDFLARRQRCHNSSESSIIPGEDDFHRWLTLTKLQAKNRTSRDAVSNIDTDVILVEEEIVKEANLQSRKMCLEPSEEDWEAALQLDDVLRCNFS